MDYMGNDDLIYTPDVVVFKTDERTEPIYPKLMEPNEWYKVDIITSAAPELFRVIHSIPIEEYERVITSRIKKILDVAAKEKDEVLASFFPPRVMADYKQMKLEECLTQTLTSQLKKNYGIDKLLYNIGRFLLKIWR